MHWTAMRNRWTRPRKRLVIIWSYRNWLRYCAAIRSFYKSASVLSSIWRYCALCPTCGLADRVDILDLSNILEQSEKFLFLYMRNIDN